MPNNEHCLYMQYPNTKKSLLTSPSFASCICQSVSAFQDSSSIQPTCLDSIFQSTYFPFGNVLMEPFSMFIGDGLPVLRKKSPNGNAENEVAVTCFTPQHCMMKLAAAKFYCHWPLFRCLEISFRRLQRRSRLLFL